MLYARPANNLNLHSCSIPSTYYAEVNCKRVMGIEPTYPAWKAGVLPLNYTRMGFPFLKEVGVTGFEPATSWSQTRRSSQAEPHPVSRSLLAVTQELLYNMFFWLSMDFFKFSF